MQGTSTSDDERAAATFLSSHDGATLRGRKLPKPTTKKRRPSRLSSVEASDEEGVFASQEVGNESWRRRRKKQKRAPNTVVEPNDEEEDEEESDEGYRPSAKKRGALKARTPAKKSRRTTPGPRRGKATTGSATPPIFPPPSTAPSNLDRLTKKVLVSLVEQAASQAKDRDAELKSSAEKLATVSQGFVELRKLCEEYKDRLSKYEIFEEKRNREQEEDQEEDQEEEVVGSEGEVERMLRSPRPEEGEDLGGMGDMAFGDADDSGYFPAGCISDAETELEVDESASDFAKAAVPVVSDSKPSLEPPPASQSRPSTLRIHSFASLHPPSPGSSQFGEDDVGRVEHEQAGQRTPPLSKLPTPALSSSPIKLGASTAATTSVFDELEERDEDVEDLGMEVKSARLRCGRRSKACAPSFSRTRKL